MILKKSFKIVLLFIFFCCSLSSHAAFESRPDSIETGKFLLLTPFKQSFSDRSGLRTKEHLMINENERIKYTLKGSRRIKRGRIIRITEEEISVYNQVTGKLEHIAIDNIEMIQRVKNWKAWTGYLSMYLGFSLFIMSLIFISIAAVLGVLYFRNSFVDVFSLMITAFYGLLFFFVGTSLIYVSTNLLYKYKRFRIGTQYKIGVYSMEQRSK